MNFFKEGTNYRNKGTAYNVTGTVYVTTGGWIAVTLNGAGPALANITQGIIPNDVVSFTFPIPVIPSFPAYFQVEYSAPALANGTLLGPFFACIDMVAASTAPTSTVIQPKPYAGVSSLVPMLFSSLLAFWIAL